MDMGDYYSKAFKGFTKNPTLALPTLIGYILIYGISIIVGIASFFILLGPEFFSSGNFDPSAISYANLVYILLLYVVIVIVSLVVSSYMSAATIGMSRSIINGEMPDLGVAVQNGNKFFLKIILVSIIIGLLLVVFALPVLLGLIIDRAYNLFPVLTIIGGLVSLILWLATPTIFIFANQSIVVSEKSVIGSLKDSVKVLRKNIVDVIVVLIINFVVIACVAVVLTLINIFLSIIPILGGVLGLILNIIIYSIMYPYFTLVLTYLYMDKKDLIYSEQEYLE